MIKVTVKVSIPEYSVIAAIRELKCPSGNSQRFHEGHSDQQCHLNPSPASRTFTYTHMLITSVEEDLLPFLYHKE